MSLSEATLNCPICDSLEHTLYPVMEGKYSGKYVCSTCHWKLWKNPNLEIETMRWDEKLKDYVPRN